MPILANMTRPKGDPKVLSTGPSSLSAADRMARNLGWLSLAIGVAELFAARKIARNLGMWGRETELRAFGVREIASGVTTLSTEKQLGLWSRVAGDAMDIAMLAKAIHPWNPRRQNAKLALLAVAGITALDVIAAVAVTTASRRGDEATKDYSDRSGFPKGLDKARGGVKRNGSAVPGMERYGSASATTAG